MVNLPAPWILWDSEISPIIHEFFWAKNPSTTEKQTHPNRGEPSRRTSDLLIAVRSPVKKRSMFTRTSWKILKIYRESMEKFRKSHTSDSISQVSIDSTWYLLMLCPKMGWGILGQCQLAARSSQAAAAATRPGERLHVAMERSTMFIGKIHYFYGKSPFLMGKSTISTGPFSIANCKRSPEATQFFRTSCRL